MTGVQTCALPIYKWGASAKEGSQLGLLRKGQKNTDPPAWRETVAAPQQAEALLLADDVILVAGCMDRLDRSKGGFLWAMSASDGKRLGDWKLPAPPVPEGLATAGNRLYVSTEDGWLRCWGK